MKASKFVTRKEFACVDAMKTKALPGSGGRKIVSQATLYWKTQLNYKSNSHPQSTLFTRLQESKVNLKKWSLENITK